MKVKYLNAFFQVHSYSGSARDYSELMRIENMLDIKEHRQHRSYKGVNHQLVLKCSSDFQLSHFIIRNLPNPLEIGQKLRTAVLLVTESPVDPAFFASFSYDLDCDLVAELNKHFVGFPSSQYAIVQNDDKQMYGCTFDVKATTGSLWKGSYVTLWTLDASLRHDLFYDLEFLGLFGTFDLLSPDLRDFFVEDLYKLHDYEKMIKDKRVDYLRVLNNAGDFAVNYCTGGSWEDNERAFNVGNILSDDPQKFYASGAGGGHLVSVKASQPFKLSHFILRNFFTRFPVKTGVLFVSMEEIPAEKVQDLAAVEYDQLKEKIANRNLTGFVFQTGEVFKDAEIEVIAYGGHSLWVEGRYVTLLLIDSWEVGMPLGRAKNIELEYLALIGCWSASEPAEIDFRVGKVSPDLLSLENSGTPTDLDKLKYIESSLKNVETEDVEGEYIEQDQVLRIVYSYRKDVDTFLYLFHNMNHEIKGQFFAYTKSQNENFALWLDDRVLDCVYNSLMFARCLEPPHMIAKSNLPCVESMTHNKIEIGSILTLKNDRFLNSMEYREFSASHFTYLDFLYFYSFCNLPVYYNKGIRSAIDLISDRYKYIKYFLMTLMSLEIAAILTLCHYSITDEAQQDQGMMWPQMNNAALICILVINLLYSFLVFCNTTFHVVLFYQKDFIISDTFKAFGDLWKYVDGFHALYGIVYAILRLSGEYKNYTDRILLVIYLIVQMIFLMKTLKSISVFGSFVRALLKNVVDIFYFLILQLLLTIGFAYVFMLVYNKTYVPEDGEIDLSIYFNENDINQYSSLYSSLYNMYKFAFLGDFDLNELANTLDWRLAAIAYIFVSIVVPVVALNALIAILGDSYNSVSEKAIGYSYKEKMYFFVENYLYYMFYWGLKNGPLYLLGISPEPFRWVVIDKLYVAFEIGEEENYDEHDDQAHNEEEGYVKSIKNEVNKAKQEIMNEIHKLVEKVNRK